MFDSWTTNSRNPTTAPYISASEPHPTSFANCPGNTRSNQTVSSVSSISRRTICVLSSTMVSLEKSLKGRICSLDSPRSLLSSAAMGGTIQRDITTAMRFICFFRRPFYIFAVFRHYSILCTCRECLPEKPTLSRPSSKI